MSLDDIQSSDERTKWGRIKMCYDSVPAPRNEWNQCVLQAYTNKSFLKLKKFNQVTINSEGNVKELLLLIPVLQILSERERMYPSSPSALNYECIVQKCRSQPAGCGGRMTGGERGSCFSRRAHSLGETQASLGTVGTRSPYLNGERNMGVVGVTPSGCGSRYSASAVIPDSKEGLTGPRKESQPSAVDALRGTVSERLVTRWNKLFCRIKLSGLLCH